MFKRIDDVLTKAELAELHAIADSATFVDGRISNPHNTAKQNLQLHDARVTQRVSEIIAGGLLRNEDFRNYAFPKAVAPPIITSYQAGMRYGLHTDTAFMMINGRSQRADVSCTVFLSDPASYDGGELRSMIGDSEIKTKLPAGSAILYPSTTLHEVTPVTRGDRRVGLTFIESRIADPAQRDLLYELNEVAALEGLRMRPENYVRMQRVQHNLLRAWGDHS